MTDMINSTEPDIQRRRMEVQAADWLTLSKSGRMTHEEEIRFETWLKEDPLHQTVVNKLAASWDALAVMSEHPIVIHDRLAGHHSQTEGESSREITGLTWFGLGRARGFSRSLAAMAASFVIVIGVSLTIYMTGNVSQPYKTAVGQQSVIQLSDSSTVHLNTDTSLRVDFSGVERRIYLENGQALFDVASDPDRPFIVSVGQANIRAVGTKFDIYKKGEAVTVAVIEGLVQVVETGVGQDSELGGGWEKDLRVGEEITVGMMDMTYEVRSIDITQATNWQSGKLDFDATPLGEIVAEFNRYSLSKIIIDDERLAEITFSGVFNATDSDQFLQALEKSFQLRAFVSPNGDRILKSASES